MPQLDGSKFDSAPKIASTATGITIVSGLDKIGNSKVATTSTAATTSSSAEVADKLISMSIADSTEVVAILPTE